MTEKELLKKLDISNSEILSSIYDKSTTISTKCRVRGCKHILVIGFGLCYKHEEERKKLKIDSLKYLYRKNFNKIIK